MYVAKKNGLHMPIQIINYCRIANNLQPVNDYNDAWARYRKNREPTYIICGYLQMSRGRTFESV